MAGGKKRRGGNNGRKSTDWTGTELAIMHRGIREGWDRQEISARLPDRSYGAMADKLLVEARKLGLAPPKRAATTRGRPSAGTILKPNASALDSAAKDRVWAKMCADGSRQLLEALERFYARRLRNLPRIRFAQERQAKKARIAA